MVETTGAPLPPPIAPRKTDPWIIAIVVCAGLCCFCVGTIGLLFAFGGPILKELGFLHAVLPILKKLP